MSVAHHDRGATASASSSAAPDSGGGVRLFATSNRNHWPRFRSAVFAAIGMFPFISIIWIVPWLAAIVAIPFIGNWQTRRAEGDPKRLKSLKPKLLTATTVNGLLYGLASLAMWFTHSPLAMIFAMAAVWVSLVYVLMQYYAEPKTFAIAASPYLAAMAAMGLDVGVRAISDGRPWRTISLFAIAAMIANFVILARRQLATSRSQLRLARAAAQERELMAAEANQAKSTFLATMSHEIRTPLNGVLGMAQALEADKLSAIQRDRVGVIRQSGEALLAILNDVLDISKIEAGKLELEETEFDLADIVLGAHSAFTALANKKGLSFALEVQDDAKGIYLGDPTRLRQILYNLISNALKFTEVGEIRVAAMQDHGALRLEVSDTGLGIPPHRLDALFSKFTQADASTTRRFGGTGLGLAICRELAELMGGQMSAQSEPGSGSRFVAVLPIPRVRDSVSSNTRAPDADVTDPQAPLCLRVLAAEDNSVNQLVLKTLLHQIGVDPVVVDNGQLAVDAWEVQEWDVILMDVQMPEMDGICATRRIREREAQTGRPRTPIVALTANAMTHQIAEYVAAGMDSHIAKPIDARRLFSVLEAILDHEDPAEAAAAA